MAAISSMCTFNPSFQHSSNITPRVRAWTVRYMSTRDLYRFSAEIIKLLTSHGDVAATNSSAFLSSIFTSNTQSTQVHALTTQPISSHRIAHICTRVLTHKPRVRAKWSILWRITQFFTHTARVSRWWLHKKWRH